VLSAARIDHHFPMKISHAEAARVLRRTGTPEPVIDAMEAELPDPFDTDATESFFERYGVSRDSLVDAMGGSP
jgi:hypothetical protein